MNARTDIVNYTAELEYKGKLRTQSQHLKSGEQILTDAPTDNNGKGEAFSPTDLVATALPACMITVMGIAAEKRGIELPEVRAYVKKTMASNPRRISRIDVEIVMMDSNLKPKDLELLKKVALACPVARSIHPDIEQVVNFKTNS